MCATAVRVQPKEGDTPDRQKYMQGVKFYDPGARPQRCGLMPANAPTTPPPKLGSLHDHGTDAPGGPAAVSQRSWAIRRRRSSTRA